MVRDGGEPRRWGGEGGTRVSAPGVVAVTGLKTFVGARLVERLVEGREVTVGVLDGKALGAIEIVPQGGFYDYKSKYQSGQSDYHFPARLTPTPGSSRSTDRTRFAFPACTRC